MVLIDIKTRLADETVPLGSLELLVGLRDLVGTQAKQTQVSHVFEALRQLSHHLVDFIPFYGVLNCKLGASQHTGLVLQNCGSKVNRNDVQEVLVVVERDPLASLDG